MSSWRFLPLSDVCEILDSKRKPVTKSLREKGSVPYYGATGVLDYVAEYLFDEKLVLLGEDGAKWGAGDKSAFIIEGKSWVNNHAHVLRPNREIILDEWLTYFLVKSDLSEFVTGVTVPKLNQARMRTIQIPVPSLQEQTVLLAKLEALLGEVENLEDSTVTQLANTKELFEQVLDSHFASVLEKHEVRPAAELLDVRDGTHDSPKFHKEGYPFITSKNLKNGKLDFSNVKYISEADFQEFNKRSKVGEGDLLFGMIGTIGNPVVVPETEEFAIKNVALIKASETYDLDFLRYYLISPTVKAQIVNSTSGTTQKFVGLGNLRRFLIPSLPKSSQIMMVEKLRRIEKDLAKVLEIQSDKLRAIRELRGTVFDHFYSGKVS